jgi:hypothetical protein
MDITVSVYGVMGLAQIVASTFLMIMGHFWICHMIFYNNKLMNSYI